MLTLFNQLFGECYKTREKAYATRLSLTFKLAVVDQIKKVEMIYKQAQNHYGIQGRSTVLVWLRKHGRLDWSQGIPIYQARPGVLMSDRKTTLTPEQRIKELERELAATQQKAEFFKAVVVVLKKNY